MAWVLKENVGTPNIYIDENDVREIVEVIPPREEPNRDGELVMRKARIAIKGPKGGRLEIRLPEFYWLEIQPEVQAGAIKPGMGVDRIGWLMVTTPNGDRVSQFSPNGRPRYYGNE